MLHETLRAGRGITVRLINYRADGSPFVNDLTIGPLFDAGSPSWQPTHFVGTIRERPLPSAQTSALSSLLPSVTLPGGSREEMGAPAVARTWLGAAARRGEPEHESGVGAALEPLKVPNHLQDALQHEAPHPQLISERRPPYKTIHVNAAWCRQCGYHAEELLGRPYSMLLGPTPAPVRAWAPPPSATLCRERER